MKQTLMIFLIMTLQQAVAQSAWTMQQCMQYAVAHNHEVKRAELDLDNYRAAKTGAIGRFLPAVDAGIGAQYNFGRAIDPETNIYTDVSTFNNGYSVQASLPVFDGFNRLHALKAAQASLLMGRHALRCQQDQTALNVLQAYTNVAYYKDMVRMADEKVQETTLLLRQTRIMEEVGRKSATDVALVESQQAEANYELTHQQNLYASALLELKKEMAFPMADSLAVSVPEYETDLIETFQESFSPFHSALLQAKYQVQSSKNEWRQTRASLFPSLSLSAGVNTSYYHTLHTADISSYSTQFKNNMGEFVGATLSIPLFNRLQTLTSIRKAKNNYKKAQEAYEQKQLELEKLSLEALHDWQGYQKQAEQMEKKVEADSLAYRLTQRQFEEGLSTAIDLHTTSTQLLKSKATLLQCRLMATVKKQLVRYYQGQTIWSSEGRE